MAVLSEFGSSHRTPWCQKRRLKVVLKRHCSDRISARRPPPLPALRPRRLCTVPCLALFAVAAACHERHSLPRNNYAATCCRVQRLFNATCPRRRNITAARYVEGHAMVSLHIPSNASLINLLCAVRGTDVTSKPAPPPKATLRHSILLAMACVCV